MSSSVEDDISPSAARIIGMTRCSTRSETIAPKRVVWVTAQPIVGSGGTERRAEGVPDETHDLEKCKP